MKIVSCPFLLSNVTLDYTAIASRLASCVLYGEYAACFDHCLDSNLFDYHPQAQLKPDTIEVSNGARSLSTAALRSVE